jgi:uncharacterized protein YceH (UPF0502 family)
MTDGPSAVPGEVGSTGELSRERDRVVRRLRSMSLDAIPLDRVLAVGQALADLAARASGSQVRVVPRLAPHAAADQIAVLVGEVEAAAAASTASGADPAEVAALLEQARVVLADLRRDL